MSRRILAGVRILDLTRVVAGPFATALLADLGAEVIKVERPRTGDDYRHGPAPEGETSLSFQNMNRGKRSITLDLRKPEGAGILLKLVRRADALVENFRAGVMDNWGLGPERIQAENPRCLFASLSGFGRVGPRSGEAGYDIISQAAGGFMALTGLPGGAPLRGGGALGDFVGGLYLALGVTAGLLGRDAQERSARLAAAGRDAQDDPGAPAQAREQEPSDPGAPAQAREKARAPVLDLSNQDCMFAIADSAASIFAGAGMRMERVGNQHPFAAPYDCYPVQDGHVVVGTASNKLFRKLMQAIGREELGRDERFRNHRVRALNRVEINRIVADWMRPRSSAEVLAALGPQGADIPCARVSSPVELIDDPQLIARGMIERHPHPTLGEVLFHGSALRFAGAPPRVRALSPELGEANQEVYGALGLSAAELAELEARGVI